MTFQHKGNFNNIGQSLFQVRTWAEEHGESDDAIYELSKIPARLGLTDHDLVSLSADQVYFEKEIAPAPYGAVSKAKDLETARRRGNSRVRNLLKRFYEAQSCVPATYGRNEWDALISFVSDREGFLERGAAFTTGKSRCLTSLRARSRVSPQDLTQSEIERIVTEATSEKRKSIRKAISFLNRLVEDFRADPEISGFLPRQSFNIPQGSDRARSIAWDSLPEDLRASCERIMDAAVAGPKELVEFARTRIKNGEDPESVMAELNETASTSRKAPGNPASAKSGYRTAITWLLRAAEDMGHDTSRFVDLEDLYDPEIIEAACQQQIERSKTSDELKDPTRSQSLGKRLTDLRTLARHGMKRGDLVALIDLSGHLNADFVVKPGKVTSDSADAVCRLIQSSPHLAANFVNAPKTIADVAEQKILKAREKKNKDHEAQGLRLYATAVAFSVQVSRPVRTANIIRLRHRSAGNLPGNLAWLTKGKHARLTFNEKEVKNSRVITVHLEGDEARILWKWLTEYRARYLELKKMEDTAYIIPGAAKPRLQKREANLPPGCVAPSTMSEIWDDGARIIGIDLTPHEARHSVATLTLAIEPGNFAKVASILGDTEETVRKHYGRDSGEAAAREVRAALKKRHPEMFRKMKGGN
jgi:hypothetical protein